MSKSLFERFRFKLGCDAQNDKKLTGTLVPEPDMYIFF